MFFWPLQSVVAVVLVDLFHFVAPTADQGLCKACWLHKTFFPRLHMAISSWDLRKIASHGQQLAYILYLYLIPAVGWTSTGRNARQQGPRMQVRMIDWDWARAAQAFQVLHHTAVAVVSYYGSRASWNTRITEAWALEWQATLKPQFWACFLSQKAKYGAAKRAEMQGIGLERGSLR